LVVGLTDHFRNIAAQDLSLPKDAVVDVEYDGFTPDRVQIFLSVPAGS
jgi:hypothetical protein